MLSLVRWTKVSKDRKAKAADAEDQADVNESGEFEVDKESVPDSRQENNVEFYAEVVEGEKAAIAKPTVEAQEIVKATVNPMLIEIPLQKVMSYLGKNDLHKCRAVCTMWNTFAMEQLLKEPQLMTTSTKDFSIWNKLTKTRFDPLPFSGISIDSPLNKDIWKFLKKTGMEIRQMEIVMHKSHKRVFFFFKKDMNTVGDLMKIVKLTPNIKEVILKNMFKNSCVLVVHY